MTCKQMMDANKVNMSKCAEANVHMFIVTGENIITILHLQITNN